MVKRTAHNGFYKGSTPFGPKKSSLIGKTMISKIINKGSIPLSSEN